MLHYELESALKFITGSNTQYPNQVKELILYDKYYESVKKLLLLDMIPEVTVQIFLQILRHMMNERKFVKANETYCDDLLSALFKKCWNADEEESKIVKESALFSRALLYDLLKVDRTLESKKMFATKYEALLLKNGDFFLENTNLNDALVEAKIFNYKQKENLIESVKQNCYFLSLYFLHSADNKLPSATNISIIRYATNKIARELKYGNISDCVPKLFELLYYALNSQMIMISQSPLMPDPVKNCIE